MVKGAGEVAERVTWALILEKIEIVRDFYQIIALFITKVGWRGNEATPLLLPLEH